MKKLKFLFYFLVALLAVFIIQGIFFGIFLFVLFIRLAIVALLIGGIYYVLNKKQKL